MSSFEHFSRSLPAGSIVLPGIKPCSYTLISWLSFLPESVAIGGSWLYMPFPNFIYSRFIFFNSNHRHFILWLVEQEKLHFASLHYSVLYSNSYGARLYQHYQGQFRKCASSCIYHTTFSQPLILHCRITSQGIF